MTTDTPSSRDEEIAVIERRFASGNISGNPDTYKAIETLLVEIGRLSAEREKEKAFLIESVNEKAESLGRMHAEYEQLRATLAERDNQLAEVKRESAMATDAANKGDDARCKAGAMSDMIDDLTAQLLAAQTVNGKIINRVREALRSILNQQFSECIDRLNDAVALSPDPTLLDEVNQKDRIKTNEINILTKENREQAALLSEVVTYLEGLAPKHEEARQLLSRLRQSTRETEEKV